MSKKIKCSHCVFNQNLVQTRISVNYTQLKQESQIKLKLLSQIATTALAKAQFTFPLQLFAVIEILYINIGYNHFGNSDCSQHKWLKFLQMQGDVFTLWCEWFLFYFIFCKMKTHHLSYPSVAKLGQPVGQYMCGQIKTRAVVFLLQLILPSPMKLI